MEPVINWALISAAVTVLAWALTIGWVKLLGQPKPSEAVLKAIVFGGSAVAAYFFAPVDLPGIDSDPTAFALALLASATLIFKTAQKIYDFAWKKLTGLVGLA